MTRRAWFVLALLLASAGCGPQEKALSEAAVEMAADFDRPNDAWVDSTTTVSADTVTVEHGRLAWQIVTTHHKTRTFRPTKRGVVVDSTLWSYESVRRLR